MATARVQRGRKSQDYVAERLQKAGWSGAEGVAASLPGKDILGTPGWAIEVKGTRKNPLPAALRQAAKNAESGEIPLVVWRPDGYGEARIDEWVVAFTFKDAVNLMGMAEGWNERGDYEKSDEDERLTPLPCGHDPERVWFDRSICPEPCGSMHNRCEECGEATTRCEVEMHGSNVSDFALRVMVDDLRQRCERLEARAS